MRLVDERFDMLRELANIFVVKAENLSTIIGEGMLASVESKNLLPFIQLRTDFKSEKINNFL